MRLSHRLEDTTLGDILGKLGRHQASGTLELRRGAIECHQLHLREGRVVHCETPLACPRLGELLGQRSELDVATRLLIRRLGINRCSEPLGERLVAKHRFPQSWVDEALERQLYMRVERLFELGCGQVRFRARARLVSPPRVSVSPTDLISGKPRRREHSGTRERQNSHSSSWGRSADVKRVQALRRLGLNGDRAEPERISAAFRARARVLHPDRFVHASRSERERAVQHFSALSAAYHFLKNMEWQPGMSV